MKNREEKTRTQRQREKETRTMKEVMISVMEQMARDFPRQIEVKTNPNPMPLSISGPDYFIRNKVKRRDGELVLAL